jgi:hypothetical protein
MAALALRLFPKASDETLAEFRTLASISLFGFAGLLVSVRVIVLDKYIPGECSEEPQAVSAEL